MNFVNEILGMVATFSLNAAIILAPLATVSLVTDIAQPIFVFLLSIVCFLLFPKLHVEDLTKSLIVKKFLIIVVVVTFLTLFLLA